MGKKNGEEIGEEHQRNNMKKRDGNQHWWGKDAPQPEVK